MCADLLQKYAYADDISDRIHRAYFMEMYARNGLAVSLALSLCDETVYCESIRLNFVRYVKSANYVLYITHVSVVMVVFFVLVLMMMVVIVMLVFMSVCVLLVMMLFMVMVMHVLIFFDTMNCNVCVGAFDTALDALFEFICDIRNAK